MTSCLGVVLAGGLSSRMGKDKAKLLRNNIDMLKFSKQLLLNSGIKDVVVSGDNYDIPDRVKQSGPVGGIYSVLSSFPLHKSPTAILILPIDLPLMTAKSLTELRLKGELSQKATYFEGHNIPLYLPNNAYVELFLSQAFSSDQLASTSQVSGRTLNSSRFKEKGPSIRALLKQVPHQAVQCSDSNALFNINTPQQWQQAKKQFNF